jgi:DNA-binding MurR/RpiR family transcriptional regulator
VANDYGFEAVFSRQVEALGVPGDLLVGISTSGNSRNVVAALEAARSQGLATVAFTGAGGGKMAALADHLFAVASRRRRAFRRRTFWPDTCSATGSSWTGERTGAKRCGTRTPRLKQGGAR